MTDPAEPRSLSTSKRPDGAPRARVWVIVVAIIALAATAFAIGRFTAFGTAAEPAPNAADVGFARDMQVHHAQAVEMAMEIYRKTGDDTLRALSYDIATGQSEQRGVMYDWIAAWGLPQTSGDPLMAWMSGTSGHAHGGASATPATQAELEASMGMASPDDLAALKAASGTAADCRFLSLMIRHHEGAISMVDAALQLASKPQVLATATAMKKTQTFEIDAMRASQSRLACS